MSSSTAAASASASPYGHVGDVAGQRLERRLLGRLAGQRQRAHGAAVEGAFGRNEFGAPGQPGDLERDLVGLGAGVAEEHPRLRVGAEVADQRLGQRDTGFGGVEVGGVAQRVQLRGDGLDDRRVAVAEHVDRDAAEQVQVGLAVGVGDHGAVAAGQRQRRGAVVVHHHRLPTLLAALAVSVMLTHAPPSFRCPRR